METGAAVTLLAGIAARDYRRIETCFAADARLRALTPHQVRELVGPRAIADQYRYWLEPLADFAILDSGATQIADRIRVRYRFTGVDPEHGPQENEHTAYAELADGLIVALNLTCAGFRPARPSA
jgi:hypothetical protein